MRQEHTAWYLAIKLRLSELEMSFLQLSRIIGVCPSYFATLDARRARPSPGVLSEVATVLGLSEGTIPEKESEWETSDLKAVQAILETELKRITKILEEKENE